MKTWLVLVIVGVALSSAPAAQAIITECHDDQGNPVPCVQDPEDPPPGGGGGDPCSISQKGVCQFMTIYPNGYWCEAGWCEPDPAAYFKCASYNTLTCAQGEDSEGNTIYVMVTDCASCWD